MDNLIGILICIISVLMLLFIAVALIAEKKSQIRIDCMKSLGLLFVLFLLLIILSNDNSVNNKVENTEIKEEISSESSSESYDNTTEDNLDAISTEDNIKTDYGTLENLEFIVDITDNMALDNNKIIGNTSTLMSYSGIIEIMIPDQLKEKVSKEINVGSTYIIETEPMLTMSLPPQTTMVKFIKADDNKIAELENIRNNISNYKECREQYEKMDLADIISDANLNYALWTQEEIVDFLDYIKSKGYTEDNENKLYVNIREHLNGSIIN